MIRRASPEQGKARNTSSLLAGYGRIAPKSPYLLTAILRSDLCVEISSGYVADRIDATACTVCGANNVHQHHLLG